MALNLRIHTGDTSEEYSESSGSEDSTDSVGLTAKQRRMLNSHQSIKITGNGGVRLRGKFEIRDGFVEMVDEEGYGSINSASSVSWGGASMVSFADTAKRQPGDESDDSTDRKARVKARRQRGTGSKRLKRSKQAGPKRVGMVITPDSLVKLGNLGAGASGRVIKVLHKETMTIMALKCIDMSERGKRSQVMHELGDLISFKTPYVVSFHGAYFEEGFLMLAIEYMNRGSLQSVLEDHGPLPEPVLADIARQCIQAFEHLCVHHKLHRDIKPANILVNHRGQVKLADFGITADLKNTMDCRMSFVGTAKYMSPERLRGEEYGTSADIWSFGVTLVKLATGDLPFSDEGGFWDILMKATQKEDDKDRIGLPSDGTFSEEFVDFVHQCLRLEPKDRPSPTELLKHKFITKYASRDELEVLRAWPQRMNMITERGELVRPVEAPRTERKRSGVQWWDQAEDTEKTIIERTITASDKPVPGKAGAGKGKGSRTAPDTERTIVDGSRTRRSRVQLPTSLTIDPSGKLSANSREAEPVVAPTTVKAPLTSRSRRRRSSRRKGRVSIPTQLPGDFGSPSRSTSVQSEDQFSPASNNSEPLKVDVDAHEIRSPGGSTRTVLLSSRRRESVLSSRSKNRGRRREARSAQFMMDGDIKPVLDQSSDEGADFFDDNGPVSVLSEKMHTQLRVVLGVLLDKMLDNAAEVDNLSEVDSAAIDSPKSAEPSTTKPPPFLHMRTKTLFDLREVNPVVPPSDEDLSDTSDSSLSMSHKPSSATGRASTGHSHRMSSIGWSRRGAPIVQAPPVTFMSFNKRDVLEQKKAAKGMKQRSTTTVGSEALTQMRKQAKTQMKELRSDTEKTTREYLRKIATHFGCALPEVVTAYFLMKEEIASMNRDNES